MQSSQERVTVVVAARKQRGQIAIEIGYYPDRIEFPMSQIAALLSSSQAREFAAELQALASELERDGS